jgi:hypothetical protein
VASRVLPLDAAATCTQTQCTTYGIGEQFGENCRMLSISVLLHAVCFKNARETAVKFKS